MHVRSPFAEGLCSKSGCTADGSHPCTNIDLQQTQRIAPDEGRVERTRLHETWSCHRRHGSGKSWELSELATRGTVSFDLFDL